MRMLKMTLAGSLVTALLLDRDDARAAARC